MWTPRKFKAKAKKMDFSSSGQGSVEVTAIYADDENLANAIELMDFEGDPIQFQVCDHCGFPGCSSGGWLSIRKLNEVILMVPGFSEMDRGTWEDSEYDPPYFTRVKGSVLMDEKKYREICALAPKLPNVEEIKPISSHELARLLQWEAPFRVLGDYPGPISFLRELLSTTSLPDDDEAVKRLLDILRLFENGDIKLELVSINEKDEKVSFFLDASDFIEWIPLVKKLAGQYGLVLKNGYSVFETNRG